MTKTDQIKVKACWARTEVLYECKLQVNPATKYWQAVDIIILTVSKIPASAVLWPDSFDYVRLFWIASAGSVTPTAWQELSRDDWVSAASWTFFLRSLRSAVIRQPGNDEAFSRGRAVRLVFPVKEGYLVRTDILPLRMVDCELVESAVSFSENPQQVYRPLLDPNPLALTEIFSTAIGGIILRPLGSTERSCALLDEELNNRIAFPWLLDTPRPQKTLVIVEGGRSSPEHGGTATSIYAAARAMGINMVVLDAPGHWLEGPQYAHWRKDFLPVQLEPPSQLTGRILEALSNAGYQHVIDGIVTFCDAYQVPVSRAAQQLGLPTAPPEAYEIATNKYRTSILDGRPAYRAHSVKEALEIAQQVELEYPLIVKPCNGWLSEGVFKVDSFSELATAISAIDSNRHGKEFVLEKYCDGPEVDFNIVLSDGEIVFYEVSDDFPKTADTNAGAEPQGETGKTSFIELANVMPSKLPAAELDILRTSLHQSLTRLGLTTGIFHLEARVHNSTMEYYTDSKLNGIVDLYPRSSSSSTPAAEPPSAWLIEINPRPPGIQETAAVEATYGIDYWGIGLVSALRDHERLRMLARPFRQGAQYWCEIVFIPVTNGGIFDSDDVCVELMQRRPDLAAHISKSFCFLKRGDKVTAFEESGVTLWVAYFVVFSRASREHLLEMTATVRRETRFKIV